MVTVDVKPTDTAPTTVAMVAAVCDIVAADLGARVDGAGGVVVSLRITYIAQVRRQRPWSTGWR
jgi:hypothetical protein